MTNETETVRAWLTAQRAAIRKQILDLETYQEAIDWLLRQTVPDHLAAPPPASNGHHIAWRDKPFDTVLAYLAGHSPAGITTRELTDMMNANSLVISRNHVASVLSKAKALGQVRQLPYRRWAMSP